MNKNEHFVLGADFGSDSVRVVVLDAADGSVQGSDVRFFEQKHAQARLPDTASERLQQFAF